MNLMNNDLKLLKPIIAEILTHFHSKHNQAIEAIKIIQTYDVLFKAQNDFVSIFQVSLS